MALPIYKHIQLHSIILHCKYIIYICVVIEITQIYLQMHNAYGQNEKEKCTQSKEWMMLLKCFVNNGTLYLSMTQEMGINFHVCQSNIQFLFEILIVYGWIVTMHRVERLVLGTRPAY